LPYLLAFLIISIMFLGSSWPMVQRLYSVRTDKEARKVAYLVAALNMLGPPLIFLPAMAARQFLPEIDDPNRVYITVCLELLPMGMIGVLVTAMLAATMSMLSSGYNSYAAVITNDVYKRLIAPGASDRTLLMMGRVTTLIVGCIPIALAEVIRRSPGSTDLFSIMFTLFSVCLPPIALPMLLGLVTNRISSVGGLCGLVFGSIVGIGAFTMGTLAESGQFPEEWAILKATQMIVLLTVSTTLIAMLIGTIWKPGTPKQRNEIDRFFEGMDAKRRASELPQIKDEVSDSPLPIIGFSMIGLGGCLLLALLLTGALVEGVLAAVVGAIMILIGVGLWFLNTTTAKPKEAILKRKEAVETEKH